MRSQRGSWLKIVIGIVIAGVVGMIALGVIGFVWIQGTIKNATDPTAIAKTAESIATISTPLPKGYKYVAGVDIAGMKMVTVTHDPDLQTLVVFMMPAGAENYADSKEAINEVKTKGINNSHMSSRIDEVKKEGTLLVGGEQMPYLIGKMSDRRGRQTESLIGSIVNKKANKMVMIIGSQPKGEYDLPTTTVFLDSIKRFNF